MRDEASSDPLKIERAVLGKIIGRLVPFLAFLYMFNILDRGNVGIAALQMKTDLRFSDGVYGLGAGIFFIGYFLFEVPSNLIMERVGARRWIARIMLSWGVISAGMMFVHTATTFYVLRFLLGLAEAGFFPGILLYLTYWVPEFARTRVIARFLSLTAILGLFGGPLGGQLLRMNGVLGYRGWQWLFFLEGLPSILLAFVVVLILPSTPDEAKWLGDAEKAWIKETLAREALTGQRVTHLSFKAAFSDPRILHLCAIFFVAAVGGNMVGFYGPQLIKARSGGLWSDPFVAAIQIIPSIVGAVAMTIAAVHADRTGMHRRHVIVGYFIAALGFLGCVFAPGAWWIVFALSLNALGERSAAGSYWALTTNLMGARAAAGGIAFINSVGNLGGFFGPTMMGRLMDRAHGDYTTGLVVATGFMFLSALLSFLLRRPSAADTSTVSEAA